MGTGILIIILFLGLEYMSYKKSNNADLDKINKKLEYVLKKIEELEKLK